MIFTRVHSQMIDVYYKKTGLAYGGETRICGNFRRLEVARDIA